MHVCLEANKMELTVLGDVLIISGLQYKCSLSILKKIKNNWILRIYSQVPNQNLKSRSILSLPPPWLSLLSRDDNNQRTY